MDPPLTNGFKLNTDGSSLGNLKVASGGGLIRNNEGNWTKGFIRYLGVC